MSKNKIFLLCHSSVKWSSPGDFLKTQFVIFRFQKYVKKGYMEMRKWIYLVPLKSVLGRSILHYCRLCIWWCICKYRIYWSLLTHSLTHWLTYLPTYLFTYAVKSTIASVFSKAGIWTKILKLRFLNSFGYILASCKMASQHQYLWHYWTVYCLFQLCNFWMVQNFLLSLFASTSRLWLWVNIHCLWKYCSFNMYICITVIT